MYPDEEKEFEEKEFDRENDSESSYEDVDFISPSPRYFNLEPSSSELKEYEQSYNLMIAERALEEAEDRLRVLVQADDKLIDKRYQKQIIKKELNHYIALLDGDGLRKFLQDHRMRLSDVSKALI